MHVSAKTDYAIRALLVMASREPGYVKIDEIVAEQDLPRKFLEVIIGELRRAGLVRSLRREDGGHALVEPADRVTLGAIMRAVDGPLAEVHGASPDRTSYPGVAQHLPHVWVAVRAGLRRVLDETTLAQVLSGDLPAHVAELVRSPGAWSAG